ncbi:MAG: zinc-dependent alcohol dehydrogenase family protein [Halobacteriales archaeon]
MRAAVLEEYGDPLAIAEVESPTPDPDGVVIEVEACGICRSDWHAWQGHGEWVDDQVPRGQVLGHEPAGTVVETGERVTGIVEGDPVAVPFCLGDGTCRYCQNGHGNVCPDGLALGFEPRAPGAFAERVHVPHAEYNAIPLPEDVDRVEVAALGCRFATAYHGLAHRADLAAGEWVAVYGCGGVGLSAIHLADAMGASTVAVDVREEPLEMARDLGATRTIDAETIDDAPAEIRALTGEGADVSVDALGLAETCRNAVASLRRGGRHVQLGLTTDAEEGEVALPLDEITMREIAVLGGRGMPPSRYDELLALLSAGRIDPGKLVTRRVPLAEVPDRLAAMGEYGTVGVEVATEF